MLLILFVKCVLAVVMSAVGVVYWAVGGALDSAENLVFPTRHRAGRRLFVFTPSVSPAVRPARDFPAGSGPVGWASRSGASEATPHPRLGRSGLTRS